MGLRWNCDVHGVGIQEYVVQAIHNLVVVLIRLYGYMPEGVAFSILLMNSVTPLIDRYVRPKPYGYVPPEKPEKDDGKKKEKKDDKKDAAKKDGSAKKDKKEVSK